MTYKEFLKAGNWLGWNLTLSKRFGDPLFSIMVAYLLKKQEEFNDEWFYITKEKMYEETAIGVKPQDRIITHLIKVGILETKNKGIPCRRFFRFTVSAESVIFGDGDILYTASYTKRGELPVGTTSYAKTVEPVTPKRYNLLHQNGTTLNIESNSIESNNKNIGERKKNINYYDLPKPKTDTELSSKIFEYLIQDDDMSMEAKRGIWEQMSKRAKKLLNKTVVEVEAIKEIIDWWAIKHFSKSKPLTLNYSAFVSALKAEIYYYDSTQPDEKVLTEQQRKAQRETEQNDIERRRQLAREQKYGL